MIAEKTAVPSNGTMKRRKAQESNVIPPTNGKLLPISEKLEKKAVFSFMTRTELSIADRVAMKYGQDIRYCPTVRAFYLWNGRYWEEDTSLAVERIVDRVIRNDLLDEAKIILQEDPDNFKEFLSFIARSQTQSKIESTVRALHKDARIVFDFTQFDQSPYLINCRNGTLDLQTMELHPHDRNDNLTFALDIDYDPAAMAPRWEAQVKWASVTEYDKATGTGRDFDADLYEYKRRLFGYFLFGKNSEQVFVIAYGEGSNGKSTEYEVMRKLLGGYAVSIQPETIMQKQHVDSRSASPDLLELRGKRLAIASEGDENQHLANGLIKRLSSGNDTQKARDLYHGFVSFTPQAKIVYYTNYPPIITDVSEGMTRRFVPIPYHNNMPKDSPNRILDYGDILLAEEGAGILNWLIAGYLEWRQQGLGSCDAVDTARNEYLDSMNMIKLFINEECVEHDICKVGYKELYTAYKSWCDGSGSVPLKKIRFKEKLAREGIKLSSGTHNVNTFLGIGLRADYPNFTPPTPESPKTHGHTPEQTTIDGHDMAESATQTAPSITVHAHTEPTAPITPVTGVNEEQNQEVQSLLSMLTEELQANPTAIAATRHYVAAGMPDTILMMLPRHIKAARQMRGKSLGGRQLYQFFKVMLADESDEGFSWVWSTLRQLNETHRTV